MPTKKNASSICDKRFVFLPGKVTVRGLAVMKSDRQLESLINWLGKMKGALPDVEKTLVEAV